MTHGVDWRRSAEREQKTGTTQQEEFPQTANTVG
jgi:hypothetical protein